MSQLGFRTANRRYTYLFWPMMAVYVLLILGASWLVSEETSPAWLKITSAIVVTVPIIGVLYAMRRLTNETDEYTRMKHLKAMRDGGLITVGALFLVGFLQIFGVVQNFEVFWFGPFFFFAYGLSNLTNCFGKVV